MILKIYFFLLYPPILSCILYILVEDSRNQSVSVQNIIYSCHYRQYCRRLMDPSTMEMLVIIRFNRDLWDEVVVDAAIKEAEPAKVAIPSQPSQLIARSSSSPQGPQIHDVNDSA